MSRNQEEERENRYQGILVEKPDESHQYWISKETRMRGDAQCCRYVFIEGEDFCLKKEENGSSENGFVTYEYDGDTKLGLSGSGRRAPESDMGDRGCVEIEWTDSDVCVKGEGSYSRRMGNLDVAPCTITMVGSNREYRGPLDKDLEPNGHGIVTVTDGRSSKRVSSM